MQDWPNRIFILIFDLPESDPFALKKEENWCLPLLLLILTVHFFQYLADIIKADSAGIAMIDFFIYLIGSP